MNFDVYLTKFLLTSRTICKVFVKPVRSSCKSHLPNFQYEEPTKDFVDNELVDGFNVLEYMIATRHSSLEASTFKREAQDRFHLQKAILEIIPELTSVNFTSICPV